MAPALGRSRTPAAFGANSAHNHFNILAFKQITKIVNVLKYLKSLNFEILNVFDFINLARKLVIGKDLMLLPQLNT